MPSELDDNKNIKMSQRCGGINKATDFSFDTTVDISVCADKCI